MGRVDYDRGKLLKAAAIGAAAALLFIFVLINPDFFASSRRGRWLTGGFVYAFLVPLMTLACLHFAWRAGSLACGDLLAVELTPTHLKLNSYRGLKLVRWADVLGARLEANMNQPQLCVATRSGGLFGGKKIRLPLGLTNLPPAEVGLLVAAIGQGAGSAPAPNPVRDDSAPSPSFDPDAAIARYLERRAREAEPVAPAAPVSPPRPVFGRKQA